MKDSSNVNKIKNNKKLTSLLLLILLFLITIIGYFIYKNKDKDSFQYEDNAIFGLMPGVDRDALLAEMQANVDKSAIAFSINSRPVFLNSYINIMFENPDGNDKDLIIRIFDDATGELLYESKAIREGSYIDRIKINKSYSKGEHILSAYLTAYDVTTHELIGEAAAELILTAE